MHNIKCHFGFVGVYLTQLSQNGHAIDMHLSSNITLIWYLVGIELVLEMVTQFKTLNTQAFHREHVTLQLYPLRFNI
jgi:hypothetical protein